MDYEVDKERARIFLENNCPNLWSLLNNKAKNNLPEGFVEYLSPSPDFYYTEFSNENAVEKLCNRLKHDGIRLKPADFNNDHKVLGLSVYNALNDLLKQDKLFERLLVIRNGKILSSELDKLKNDFSNRKSKYKLKKLNRQALELFYHKETPKLAHRSKGQINDSKRYLQSADKAIGELLDKAPNRKTIENGYKNDLSGVDTADQLAQFLCEITLASSLAKLSNIPPQIHPRINEGRNMKGCDVMVNIEGFDVYAEAKRYEDKSKTHNRSISQRCHDLCSKINGDRPVPDQFPDGTINILFVFQSSFLDSEENIKDYIEQTLCGFTDNSVNPPLHEDGLFSLDKWQKVSACCYVRIEQNKTFKMIKIWENPNANKPVPPVVLRRLSLDNDIIPKTGGIA